MALNGKINMTLVMLAIFISMVVAAAGYPTAAGLLPLVIGVPAVILTFIQLVIDIKELRRERAGIVVVAKPSMPGEDEDGPPVDGQIRREVKLFAYFIGLVAAVLLLGFWIAIPLFMFSFLRLHESESMKVTLIMTLGSWGVLYLMFDKVLQIILHKGFLIESIFG